MKIYDCFPFFNEIDLLKIRLELLYEHVDQFVLCESNVTFSGNPKRYIFEENKSQFSRWLDKIVHLKFEPDVSALDFVKPASYDPSHAAWSIEAAQRDLMASELRNIEAESLVFQSDVDEIWNPEKLDLLAGAARDLGIVRVGMQLHYFYMNCKGIGPTNSQWIHPYCATGAALQAQASLNKIRVQADLKFVSDSGWHFSYLGGPQAIIYKIDSFSHQEFNTDHFKEESRIERCMNLGLDPFDRPGVLWAFFHVDSYPVQLAKLMRKNPAFVKTELM